MPSHWEHLEHRLQHLQVQPASPSLDKCRVGWSSNPICCQKTLQEEKWGVSHFPWVDSGEGRLLVQSRGS